MNPRALLSKAKDAVSNRERAVVAARQADRTDPTAYRDDPCGYASNVLKVQWWDVQREIARGLVTPPYRVKAKASHGVGKSHVAAGLVNWWYDSFNPGVCLTTAPTERQVKDALWKQVRVQRGVRGGFVGPKLPRLESAPDHFAHGFTARDATSFQGQHEEHVLLIFDEAVGVAREFWESGETMLQGPRCAFLALYNPTDTTSFAYADEQDDLSSGRAKVIEIPATIHPNIIEELAGRPAPYPKAIRLDWLTTKIKKWCERIDAADATATDLEWPPGSGIWYRPGPLAQARLLARWPEASSGVWGDALWAAAEQAVLAWHITDLPQIGCDVARFGDDWTEIHVRCGPVSLFHECHNGWSTDQTAGRLKQLCREYAAFASAQRDRQAKPITANDIVVKIDDDGVGGGVLDQAGGLQWQGVSASSTAIDTEDYPNVRSELWFTVAERARRGKLSLVRLPAEVRRELKRQAMAPAWTLDGSGRRVVEGKDITKKKIGRSPDGLDAMNLSYYEPMIGIPEVIVKRGW